MIWSSTHASRWQATQNFLMSAMAPPHRAPTMNWLLSSLLQVLMAVYDAHADWQVYCEADKRSGQLGRSIISYLNAGCTRETGLAPCFSIVRVPC